MSAKHHPLTCLCQAMLFGCISALWGPFRLQDHDRYLFYSAQCRGVILRKRTEKWRRPKCKDRRSLRLQDFWCIRYKSLYCWCFFCFCFFLQQIDINLASVRKQKWILMWLFGLFWKIAHTESSSKEASPCISLLEMTFFSQSKSWTGSHLESHTRVITILESVVTFQGNLSQANRGQTQIKSLRAVLGPRRAAADWRRRRGLNGRQSATQTAEEREAQPAAVLADFSALSAALNSAGAARHSGATKTALCPAHNGANKLFVSGTTSAHTHTRTCSEASVIGSHSFRGLCK